MCVIWFKVPKLLRSACRHIIGSDLSARGGGYFVYRMPPILMRNDTDWAMLARWRLKQNFPTPLYHVTLLLRHRVTRVETRLNFFFFFFWFLLSSTCWYTLTNNTIWSNHLIQKDWFVVYTSPFPTDEHPQLNVTEGSEITSKHFFIHNFRTSPKCHNWHMNESTYNTWLLNVADESSWRRITKFTIIIQKVHCKFYLDSIVLFKVCCKIVVLVFFYSEPRQNRSKSRWQVSSQCVCMQKKIQTCENNANNQLNLPF